MPRGTRRTSESTLVFILARSASENAGDGEVNRHIAERSEDSGTVSIASSSGRRTIPAPVLSIRSAPAASTITGSDASDVRVLTAVICAGDENDYRIVRPNDGPVRWILARGDIERDPNGKALRHVGAHIDITEQKRAQDILRKSEERQALLSKLTDALRPLADPVPMQDEAIRRLAST